MTSAADLVHEMPIHRFAEGNDWLKHFLKEDENVTQFKQRLVEVEWEAGRVDTHGSTLTGALLWKALEMHSRGRQKKPLSHVLRALAWTSPKEAALLPLADLWWATVFFDTSFVRYSDWGASYNKAKAALRGPASTKKRLEEVDVLSQVLDQAVSRRPLEEWGWKYPEKAMWNRIRNLSLGFSGEHTIDPVLTLLCHPVVAHLAQSVPSGVWEWSWWMREVPQAWEKVLKHPRAWEAMEGTGLGTRGGSAERLRENARVLAGIGKGLKLEPQRQQELEKLCKATTFLEGLRVFWMQHHFGNAWTEAVAFPKIRL